jgi:hypothetical protein
MAKLGYSSIQIQTELLKRFPKDADEDHREAFRKYAYRLAKKGISRFLET